MKKLFLFSSMLATVAAGNALDSGDGYTLSVIADEEVPLSGGIREEQFALFAFIAVGVVLISLITTIYLVKLHHMRQRYLQLVKNSNITTEHADRTLNIYKLKGKIKRLEDNLAAKMILT